MGLWVLKRGEQELWTEQSGYHEGSQGSSAKEGEEEEGAVV
jgi:hypothetical protein